MSDPENYRTYKYPPVEWVREPEIGKEIYAKRAKYKGFIQREHPKRLDPLWKRFREENKINEELEILINNITLEELIQLKLEISTRMCKLNRFVGFPMWAYIPRIARQAILNFIASNFYTKVDGAGFLGKTIRTLQFLFFRYNVKWYWPRRHKTKLTIKSLETLRKV